MRKTDVALMTALLFACIQAQAAGENSSDAASGQGSAGNAASGAIRTVASPDAGGETLKAIGENAAGNDEPDTSLTSAGEHALSLSASDVILRLNAVDSQLRLLEKENSELKVQLKEIRRQADAAGKETASSISRLQRELTAAREGLGRDIQKVADETAGAKKSSERRDSNLQNSIAKTQVGLETETEARKDAVLALEKSVADARNSADRHHLSMRDRYERLSMVLTVAASVLTLFILLAMGLLVLRLRKLSRSAILASEKQERFDSRQSGIEDDLNSLNQKLLEYLEKKDSAGAEGQDELALSVANELARIQTNLFRMDRSVKGWKQLDRAVARIAEIFGEKGYEIRNLLGTDYSDNLKCSATFNDDDSIEEGKQIITGIKKAMVIRNGQMIQAPEITVSVNNG